MALRRSPRVVEWPRSGASANVPFGYSISGNIVTIAAGKWIIHGQKVMDVAEAAVTVSGGTTDSPHYIFAKHSLAVGSASIQTTATATFPTSTANLVRWPLWAVGLAGGTAFIVQQLWSGYIHQGSPV